MKRQDVHGFRGNLPGDGIYMKKITCIISEAYEGNSGFTTVMIIHSALVGLKFKGNLK